MSFDSRETSEYEGKPRELYWFMRGDEEWHYSSGVEEVEFQFDTYTPIEGLSRSAIRDGRERSRNQLTVELPRTAEVALLYQGIPNTAAVWLNIYELHEGEDEYAIAWQGRVRGCEFKGAVAILTLDSLLASTKKQSLRHLYQNQCNHFTFDANCGLSEATYSVASQTVLTIEDNVLTIDNANAADFFRAGQVKRANGDRRFIVSDSKAGSTHTLTLLQPFEDMEAGEVVTLIGGACLHTFTTCQATKLPGGSTADNSANYGGYPKVPRKNPFKSIY